MFDWVENRLLDKDWNIEFTLVPSPQLSRKNTQPENMCDIVFEKVKDRGGTVNRMRLYGKAAVGRVF